MYNLLYPYLLSSPTPPPLNTFERGRGGGREDVNLPLMIAFMYVGCNFQAAVASFRALRLFPIKRKAMKPSNSSVANSSFQ